MVSGMPSLATEYGWSPRRPMGFASGQTANVDYAETGLLSPASVRCDQPLIAAASPVCPPTVDWSSRQFGRGETIGDRMGRSTVVGSVQPTGAAQDWRTCGGKDCCPPSEENPDAGCSARHSVPGCREDDSRVDEIHYDSSPEDCAPDGLIGMEGADTEDDATDPERPDPDALVWPRIVSAERAVHLGRSQCGGRVPNDAAHT